jgi:capsular polysaccharide biosynthesis protein
MNMRWTDVGAAVRSARWVLVVLVVVGALGGLLLDLRQDRLPVSSTAQLTVSDASGAPASSDAAETAVSYITAQMPTYASIATSDDVLGPAAASAGTTVAALRPEVTAAEVPDTTLLTVDVRASTSAAATAEAGAVTESLTAAITRVETRPGQPSRVAVATTSGPSVPAERFVPPLGTLAAGGALAGALLVLLGALAWATTVPQRVWRRFSAWLFRRPSDAELTRVGAEDPAGHGDDLEQALARTAGRWLSKLRDRG